MFSQARTLGTRFLLARSGGFGGAMWCRGSSSGGGAAGQRLDVAVGKVTNSVCNMLLVIGPCHSFCNSPLQSTGLNALSDALLTEQPQEELRDSELLLAELQESRFRSLCHTPYRTSYT